MLTFERTADAELVRSIVTHPKVYRGSLLSDFAPARENYHVPTEPANWYLVARYAEEPLGVFVFCPYNPVWWEVHLAMLPLAWGIADELSHAMVRWLRENSPCKKLTATIPEYNRLTLALARRIGMSFIGTNSKSTLKDGSLRDQHIFGLEI